MTQYENLNLNRLLISINKLGALSSAFDTLGYAKQEGNVTIPADAYEYLCDVQNDLVDEARSRCLELIEETEKEKGLCGQ